MQARHLLHPSQIDVFYDQLLDVESPRYNTGGYIRLLGVLDVNALQEALSSVVSVFDAFRMRFDLSSVEPYFYVVDTTAIAFDIIDFSREIDAIACARRWMQQRFNEPFIFVKENLLCQASLLKIDENEYFFFNKYHHLITDGFGFAIWADFIARRYSEIIGGSVVEINYPSYLAEVKEAIDRRNGAGYEAARQYWTEKFGVLGQGSFLRPKMFVGRSTRVGKYSIVVSSIQRRRLDHLQGTLNCSLQQLTIAAFMIYFGRTTS